MHIVLAPSEADRKKLVAKILGRLPSSTVVRYEAGETPFAEILAQVAARDLFETASVIVVERCELLKKEDLALLVGDYPHLILSGASLKQNVPSAQMTDLTAEKPWDRKRRLANGLIEEAAVQNKKLAPEALSYLLDEVSLDPMLLEQELNKLACFVGERTLIALADARALCQPLVQLTGWQVAENLIWGETPLREEPPFDFSWIGQIRYHLQLGEQIRTGGAPSRQTEKYLSLVKKRPSHFFAEGLKSLFRLELSTKTSTLDPSLAWVRFKAELSHV